MVLPLNWRSVRARAASAVSREMEKERGMEYSYVRERQALVDNLLNQAAEALSMISAFDDAIDDQIVSSIFQAYGPEREKRKTGEWIDIGNVL